MSRYILVYLIHVTLYLAIFDTCHVIIFVCLIHVMVCFAIFDTCHGIFGYNFDTCHSRPVFQ